MLMPEPTPKPTCFIAMPITTREEHLERYNGDSDHWQHVLETLFIPAVVAAGFEPISPAATGSEMIHARIINSLVSADMVLCDLSTRNPNVLFELGVRTAVNRPVALVRDDDDALPFDVNGINTLTYRHMMHGWQTKDDVNHLTEHLRETAANATGNPLWQHFGLTITATEPPAPGNATDARLELLQESVAALGREIQRLDSSAQDPPSVRTPPSQWMLLARHVAELIVDALGVLATVEVTPLSDYGSVLVEIDAGPGGLSSSQAIRTATGTAHEFGLAISGVRVDDRNGVLRFIVKFD